MKRAWTQGLEVLGGRGLESISYAPGAVSRGTVGRAGAKKSRAERQEREDTKRHRTRWPERYKAINRASFTNVSPLNFSKFPEKNASGTDAASCLLRMHWESRKAVVC